MSARTQGADGSDGRVLGGADGRAVEDVEHQVARLLRMADRSRRRATRLDGTLERASYLALSLLADRPTATINDIADALRLDASTVTRQVLAMEAAGHVTRTRDTGDARRTNVAMTPDGADALARTRAARRDVYADVLAGWSPDDQRLLAALLTRLNEDLDGSTRRWEAGTADPAGTPSRRG